MNEILTFAIDNWILTSLFFAILITIIVIESNSNNLEKHISSEKLVDLFNHENAVIIDIRESNLFQKGHIAGSKNIPQKDLSKNNKKLQKFSKKPIIFICENGSQSTKITKDFKNSDFKSINTLNGGINAWTKAGLPLTKGK